MGKHTELPWEVSSAVCGEHKTETVAIYHYPSESVCVEVIETGCKCGDEALSIEDAQLIVTAVNNHARLVEALREVSGLDQMSMENAVGWLEDNCQDIRTLLAQLDGELE